jgi:Fe-S cluster assembly protein SufD
VVDNEAKKINLRAGEELKIIWWREGSFSEEVEVNLTGRGARCEITHLVWGQAEEKAQLQVTVRHRAPETVSKVTVRAAVKDEAQINWRGLIEIAAEGRGAEGYQHGRGLILNRGAVIEMLPELKIETNEVRCSHGVTTSHLDEVTLFYMRSRGLGEREARRLAVLGFFQDELALPTKMVQRLEEII